MLGSDGDLRVEAVEALSQRSKRIDQDLEAGARRRRRSGARIFDVRDQPFDMGRPLRCDHAVLGHVPSEAVDQLRALDQPAAGDPQVVSDP